MINGNAGIQKGIKLVLIFYAVITLGLSKSYAQDPHFSQFYSAPLQINPAFAGSWTSGRVCSNYRLQWPMLHGFFQTFYTSYDQYLHKIRGGVAVSYLRDVSGDGVLTNDAFDYIYSGYIPFKRDSTGKAKFVIQPAIGIGYKIQKTDWSFSFGDMIDPRRGFLYTTQEQKNLIQRNFWDFSFGTIFYSKRILGGFAFYHLTEPDNGLLGLSPLPRTSVFHLSGILGKISDSTKSINIIPTIYYMQQQDFRNFICIVNAKYDKYSIGFGFRANDALLFSAGFDYKFFKVSYSYDLTISELSGQTGGSHEMSCTYKFFNKKWKGKRLNLQRYNF